MKKIRVLVAEDLEQVLIGTVAWLTETHDFAVVGTATTPSEVLEKVERLAPDVVVLDLKWSRDTDEKPGLKLCREIAINFPATRIVANSMYRDALDKARHMGATRVVYKAGDKEDLIEAVRWAAGRPPADRVVPDLQFESLTPREIEVLQCAQYGRTDRQIGQELGISHNTVKGYIQEGMRKLGAANRTEAVAKAIHLGLITS